MKVQNSILLLLMLSIVSLIGCKDEEVEPSQLLLNSDVEAGNRDPESWWNSRSPQSEVNWSTVEAFSGEKSLHIERETLDSINFSHWAQTITTNIPVGKNVTLNAKMKGELKGTGISMVIRADNSEYPEGNGEQFISSYSSFEIKGDFDWTDYSLKLDNVGEDIKSLTVYLIYLPNTTGDVYYDDITLTYD